MCDLVYVDNASGLLKSLQLRKTNKYSCSLNDQKKSSFALLRIVNMRVTRGNIWHAHVDLVDHGCWVFVQ